MIAALLIALVAICVGALLGSLAFLLFLPRDKR